MNIVEKRDFIHSQLQCLDEVLIDELFEKIKEVVGEDDLIIGYLPGGCPITKAELIARGNCSDKPVGEREEISIRELPEMVNDFK